MDVLKQTKPLEELSKLLGVSYAGDARGALLDANIIKKLLECPDEQFMAVREFLGKPENAEIVEDVQKGCQVAVYELELIGIETDYKKIFNMLQRMVILGKVNVNEISMFSQRVLDAYNTQKGTTLTDGQIGLLTKWVKSKELFDENTLVLIATLPDGGVERLEALLGVEYQSNQDEFYEALRNCTDKQRQVVEEILADPRNAESVEIAAIAEAEGKFLAEAEVEKVIDILADYLQSAAGMPEVPDFANMFVDEVVIEPMSNSVEKEHTITEKIFSAQQIEIMQKHTLGEMVYEASDTAVFNVKLGDDVVGLSNRGGNVGELRGERLRNALTELQSKNPSMNLYEALSILVRDPNRKVVYFEQPIFLYHQEVFGLGDASKEELAELPARKAAHAMLSKVALACQAYVIEENEKGFPEVSSREYLARVIKENAREILLMANDDKKQLSDLKQYLVEKCKIVRAAELNAIKEKQEVVKSNPRSRKWPDLMSRAGTRWMKHLSRAELELKDEIIPRTPKHGAWTLGAQLFDSRLKEMRTEVGKKGGHIVRLNMTTNDESSSVSGEEPEDLVRLKWFDHTVLDVTTGKNQTIASMRAFQENLYGFLDKQADVYCHCMAGRSRSVLETESYMYFHPNQKELFDFDESPELWGPLWTEAKENLVIEKAGVKLSLGERIKLSLQGKSARERKKFLYTKAEKKLGKDFAAAEDEALKKIESLKGRLRVNPSFSDIAEFVKIRRPKAKAITELDGDQAGLVGLMVLSKMTDPNTLMIEGRSATKDGEDGKERLIRDAQDIGLMLSAPVDRAFRSEQDLTEHKNNFLKAYNAFQLQGVDLLMAMMVPVGKKANLENKLRVSYEVDFESRFNKLKPSEQVRLLILIKGLMDQKDVNLPFQEGEGYVSHLLGEVMAKHAGELTAGDQVELFRTFGAVPKINYEQTVEKILAGSKLDRYNAGIQLAELVHVMGITLESAGIKPDAPLIEKVVRGEEIKVVDKSGKEKAYKLSPKEVVVFVNHLRELKGSSFGDYLEEKVKLDPAQFKAWFKSVKDALTPEEKEHLVDKFREYLVEKIELDPAQFKAWLKSVTDALPSEEKQLLADKFREYLVKKVELAPAQFKAWLKLVTDALTSEEKQFLADKFREYLVKKVELGPTQFKAWFEPVKDDLTPEEKQLLADKFREYLVKKVKLDPAQFKAWFKSVKDALTPEEKQLLADKLLEEKQSNKIKLQVMREACSKTDLGDDLYRKIQEAAHVKGPFGGKGRPQREQEVEEVPKVDKVVAEVSRKDEDASRSGTLTLGGHRED